MSYKYYFIAKQILNWILILKKQTFFKLWILANQILFSES